MGSPRYLAPEQLSGREVDQRTDLYGLGVLLYECLAGKSPYDADSLPGLMAQIAMSIAPQIPQASTGPNQWLQRLMSKGRDGRPASAEAALQSWIASVPLPTSS